VPSMPGGASSAEEAGQDRRSVEMTGFCVRSKERRRVMMEMDVATMREVMVSGNADIPT